jgi:hypothetical protein
MALSLELDHFGTGQPLGLEPIVDSTAAGLLDGPKTAKSWPVCGSSTEDSQYGQSLQGLDLFVREAMNAIHGPPPPVAQVSLKLEKCTRLTSG